MAREISTRKAMEFDEMLRQLVVHYGWWNTLNHLANMAHEKSAYRMPVEQPHWDRLNHMMFTAAGYYSKFLDKGEVADAKQPDKRKTV